MTLCKAGNLLTLTLAIGLSSPLQAADNNDNACGFNETARRLAALIMQDTHQQRSHITCHPLLAQAAEDKARTMADYGMVRHNLGGSPNGRLREIGFPIPHYYSGVMGNQVEAIAGGYSTAESVWDAFKHSTSHRQHLLGELDFYREQQYIGVGFYKDKSTPHVEYWTVYLTEAASDSAVPAFEYIPNKGVFFVEEPEIAVQVFDTSTTEN
ncbi:CAP domain-containing protein [Aestuariibacter sp. GS-14]|uniref:CAP domain-containing protein n=1 Tax=Aestuariibacter sp. GS-14 TaxID=2590670 RepID=UPI0015E83415|nr:CAP domain-containing protein [Aestuariibacter sp. GS-14]